jgi:hypothetical protein
MLGDRRLTVGRARTPKPIPTLSDEQPHGWHWQQQQDHGARRPAHLLEDAHR